MKKENRIRFYPLWGVAIAVLVVALTVTAVLWLWPWENDAPPDTTGESNGTEELVCLQFSRYSGAFVEDGSDEAVSNVAAMLVANTGSEFLDLATVTYDAGGQTATFVVTGLPPGEKAWVLESNRMILADGIEFRLRDCATTFRPDAVTQTDLLSVTPQGDTLTVENTSDRTLENVCVYYKVYHTDGNYLGGITYMLSFGTLKPGESARKQSVHYGEDARIVRFSYQTE